MTSLETALHVIEQMGEECKRLAETLEAVRTWVDFYGPDGIPTSARFANDDVCAGFDEARKDVLIMLNHLPDPPSPKDST